MSRITRVCVINYPHRVTQRGNNRETVFFEGENREFYLKTLSTYSHEWAFEIWAYCLMTNHIHILIVLGEEESLARGIGEIVTVTPEMETKRIEWTRCFDFSNVAIDFTFEARTEPVRTKSWKVPLLIQAEVN